MLCFEVQAGVAVFEEQASVAAVAVLAKALSSPIPLFARLRMHLTALPATTSGEYLCRATGLGVSV